MQIVSSEKRYMGLYGKGDRYGPEGERYSLKLSFLIEHGVKQIVGGVSLGGDLRWDSYGFAQNRLKGVSWGSGAMGKKWSYCTTALV